MELFELDCMVIIKIYIAKTRACVTQVNLDSKEGIGALSPSLYLLNPAPKSFCVK